MKYLKDESYYNDLYDRFTINECRRMEMALSKVEYKPKTKSDKKSKKKEIKVTFNLASVPLCFIKGERYLKKAETIRKWMEKDRAQDEKIEKTPPPRDIFCTFCNLPMETTIKDLHSNLDESKNKVLFFFECSACGKRKAVYEDGKEWQLTPTICPKCQNEMLEESQRKANKIITVYTCPKCHYKEKDIFDLDEKPKPEKIDPDFKKDRQRFCLSEKEGGEYFSSKLHLENFHKIMEDLKEKEKNKDLYDKVAKIKKLTVAELQKLLTPAMEKEDYIKLEFSQPEIGKDVIIQFTVQDNKSGRVEYDSRLILQKLIKRTLSDTNWRLMSEGINYRLGILSGRLRGYEREEDLLELIK